MQTLCCHLICSSTVSLSDMELLTCTDQEGVKKPQNQTKPKQCHTSISSETMNFNCVELLEIFLKLHYLKMTIYFVFDNTVF